MVAQPEMLADTRPADVDHPRALSHAEAASLVVPHPVLVRGEAGWEPAWLLACGPDRGDRRYLVQRDGAGSSEPEWLAEGPVALVATQRADSVLRRVSGRPAS
jgi:hypothetical protein